MSVIGDYTTTSWVAIFFDCHKVQRDGIEITHYPDGGAYFEQDQLTINLFAVIKDEIIRALAPPPNTK